MLIDYHLHNHFSPDSETATSELIQKERELGVRHLCITNHAEWFKEEEGIPGSFGYEEAVERFRKTKMEINDLQAQFPDMQIVFGAEIQYQEGYMDAVGRLTQKMPFDFILGSVHIVDNVLIAGGNHAGDLFSGMDEENAYTKYFEEMIKLIEWGHLDVTAHFDICKKYGHEYYGPFKPQSYKPIITKVLEMMKARGIGMELNTGSLHKRCKELFPHPDILKWCLEVGIEHFTLGSDAHELSETGRHLEEALGLAKDVGIKTLSTYIKRKPTKHKI